MCFTGKGKLLLLDPFSPNTPHGAQTKPIRVSKYLQPLFTFALCPTGLGSSHFVVRMVASLCIIWGTFPVWRISIRVDFPCRGGPMTIIFISLHFSALRSCARRYASTVLGPIVRGGRRQALSVVCSYKCTYVQLDCTKPTAADVSAELIFSLKFLCGLRRPRE